MARAVRIHKKVFMPPKMPKVCGMSFPNFKTKMKAARPPACQHKCVGGPWHDKYIATSFTGSNDSLIIRVGNFVGRYKLTLDSTQAIWEDVNVQIH